MIVMPPMIDREFHARQITCLLKRFPVVAILGARQVGKTTLAASIAPTLSNRKAFHAPALEHGGSDEGAPGTRPYYEPTFFVAYVRDPDGNKLVCVYHKQKP